MNDSNSLPQINKSFIISLKTFKAFSDQKIKLVLALHQASHLKQCQKHSSPEWNKHIFNNKTSITTIITTFRVYAYDDDKRVMFNRTAYYYSNVQWISSISLHSFHPENYWFDNFRNIQFQMVANQFGNFNLNQSDFNPNLN